jgi:hypothetical protein
MASGGFRTDRFRSHTAHGAHSCLKSLRKTSSPGVQGKTARGRVAHRKAVLGRVARGRVVARGKVAHRKAVLGRVVLGRVVVAWDLEGLAEVRVLEVDRFRGRVSRRACRRAVIRGCILVKDFRRGFPGGDIPGFRRTHLMEAWGHLG